MRFWDISLPLDHTTIAWPGDTKFTRKENRGSGIVSKLILSTHAGTHIDAPKHFLFDRNGVDQIALSKLIGMARVLPINSANQIIAKDLKRFTIKAHDKILFKTRNSKLLRGKKFTADYVSLSLEGAKYLAGKNIDLVGTDYFGIEAKGSAGHPVHKVLLKSGIVVLEGADLSKVKPGIYNIAALPLKIKAGDGSPARAVLWK